MPGLPVVSSRAPRENSSSAPFRGNAGAVVLDLDVDQAALRLDGDEHPSAAIFGGILDEVAEHLVEVLALDPDLRPAVAGDIDGDAFVKAVDRALDRLEAFPHATRANGRRRGGRWRAPGRDDGRPGGA